MRQLLALVAPPLCIALVAVAVAVTACGPPAPAAPSVPVRTGPPSRTDPPSRTVTGVGALSGVTAGGPGSVAVVPFAEADAAAIRPNQPARASFDAIPGLELPGTVLAVAPTAVAISGVTNYYVTIVLGAGDPRLRAGQTVRVTVTTEPVPPGR